MIVRLILSELARQAFMTAKKRVVDAMVGRRNKTPEERMLELEDKLNSVEKRLDRLDGSVIYQRRNMS